LRNYCLFLTAVIAALVVAPGAAKLSNTIPPSGPTPRTADGKPDLSGIWSPNVKYVGNIAADMKPGDLPMQPWAEKLTRERTESHSKEDPEARCLPTGVPRITPYPYKIVQTPSLVVMLFEGNIHSYRQFFLDGRGHPKDPDPSWYGDSIGKWDGDALVVDSIGFNDRFWFDFSGHPHTTALHVIERYTRPDLGHLSVQITVDDPGAYTKPWTVTEVSRLLTNWEIHEYICNENNRDVEHLVGK
jgi:hypothetical protein